MTTLSFPSVGVAKMSMRLRRVVAVSESPFTLDTQVYAHQGARWEAEVSLPPLSHAEARSVEAFIVGLKGRENTFTFGNPLHTSTATATTSGITAIRSETLTTTSGGLPRRSMCWMSRILDFRLAHRTANKFGSLYVPWLRFATGIAGSTKEDLESRSGETAFAC